MGTGSKSIAFFVSPHGFGHAARASAVIEAYLSRSPETTFHLFTTVPDWFFINTIRPGFEYHSLATDVGFVQLGPTTEDLPATFERLKAFYPPPRELIESLANELTELNCKFVVCDISPLGLLIAERAGLPSVLIENFTWDFIYRGYTGIEPRLAEFADYLGPVFRKASHHYQCEPLCVASKHAVKFPPICRQIKTDRSAVRKKLGISMDIPLVLISMGGTPADLPFTAQLASIPGVRFLVLGNVSSKQVTSNTITLSSNSGFHHPDLVSASDLIVSKLGYSTVAEAYQAGIPFAYISRDQFPESPIIERFIQKNLKTFRITQEEFAAGQWLPNVREWTRAPKSERRSENGAALVADILVGL